MNITNWSKAIETLSEKMPDPVTIIKASEHTLRMFSLHACAFDRETCKDDLDKGIRGYYWGLTFMADPNLKHGVFAYYEGDTLKGALDFTACADGVFTPAIIQE